MFCISWIYTIRSSVGLQKNNLIIAIPTIKWTGGKIIKTIKKKNIQRKCKDPSFGLLIHRTTQVNMNYRQAKMLTGRKLRNNLLVVTKNSNISVSLKERGRQRIKQKIYFDRRGTRELELLKPGDPVRIWGPIKKR